MNPLNMPLFTRIRRNHALEHATIHMLTGKHHPLRVVGRSTINGFYLYGNLTTEAVAEAVQEAHSRLLAGEHHLAVHPNCGTNLVTAGSLAGLASYAALSVGNSKKRRIEMLPNALLAATAALILAQPIGPRLQAHLTTLAELGGLTIKGIRREDRGNMVVHFIQTG